MRILKESSEKFFSCISIRENEANLSIIIHIDLIQQLNIIVFHFLLISLYIFFSFILFCYSMDFLNEAREIE
jgi:hypothetical protein